jgi:hypothetical protein
VVNEKPMFEGFISAAYSFAQSSRLTQRDGYGHESETAHVRFARVASSNMVLLKLKEIL